MAFFAKRAVSTLPFGEMSSIRNFMLLLHKIGKQGNRRSIPDFAVEAAVSDGFGNVETVDAVG